LDISNDDTAGRGDQNNLPFACDGGHDFGYSRIVLSRQDIDLVEKLDLVLNRDVSDGLLDRIEITRLGPGKTRLDNRGLSGLGRDRPAVLAESSMFLSVISSE
jgi:hypothetical protein